MPSKKAQPSVVITGHLGRPRGELGSSCPSGDAPASATWNREKLSPLNRAQIPDPQIISNNTAGYFFKPLSFGIFCYIAIGNWTIQEKVSLSNGNV